MEFTLRSASPIVRVAKCRHGSDSPVDCQSRAEDGGVNLNLSKLFTKPLSRLRRQLP